MKATLCQMSNQVPATTLSRCPRAFAVSQRSSNSSCQKLNPWQVLHNIVYACCEAGETLSAYPGENGCDHQVRRDWTPDMPQPFLYQVPQDRACRCALTADSRPWGMSGFACNGSCANLTFPRNELWWTADFLAGTPLMTACCQSCIAP